MGNLEHNSLSWDGITAASFKDGPEADSAAVVGLICSTPARRELIHQALRLLETPHLQILEARTLSEALDALRDAARGVLLWDIAEPPEAAARLIERCKREMRTREVALLALHAASNEALEEEWLKAGAEDALCGPLRPRELAARVRLVLRLRRAALELQQSNEQRAKHSHAMLVILDLCCHLNFAETLEDVLRGVARAAASLTHSRQAAILLSDPRRETLRMAEGLGIDEKSCAAWETPIAGSVIGEVFASGQSALVPEPAALPAQDGWRPRDAYVCAALAGAADNGAGCSGVLCVSGRCGTEPYTPMDLEYLELLGNFAGAAVQGVQHRAWREQAQDSLVLALVGLTERRNRDTARHLERVTTFALMLADELRKQPRFGQIDEPFLQQLRRAMPLHDVGKVAIPDRILLKPGRLTPEEMEVMKTHAAIGGDTIAAVRTQLLQPQFVQMAEEIARHHHEWFDGKGYPGGLSGEAIPLAARIAAVADVYDALTTKRVYKPALTHEAALDIIRNATGRQFDPRIVDALLRRQEDFKYYAELLRDEEEPAAVENAAGNA